MFFKAKKEKGPHQLVLPLLPLRDVVIFPYMIAPLFVGRSRSVSAIDESEQRNNHIVVATQREAHTDEPKPEDICQVGVVAEILQSLRLPDGTIKLLVEGLYRVEIADYLQTSDYFEVEVRRLEDEINITPEVEALMRDVNQKFEQYVKLNLKIPPEIITATTNVKEPGHLVDVISAHLPLKIKDKQTIIETFAPQERLEKLAIFLASELDILQIEKKIRGRVRRQMEKSQKEYYLNEQMKAIQRELGTADDHRSELQQLR